MANSNKHINILIVEDSSDDAELIELTLKKHGFIFSSNQVCTEEDYLSELEKDYWDLIICDYSMPAFDAMKALEIKKQKELDIPFILVSGTVGEELAVDAMINGAQDYVMKDNLHRLGVAIEREIKNYKVRLEKSWADKKFRLLFENSPDGVIMSDYQGNITEANHAALNLLGISQQDISRHNFFDMLVLPSYEKDIFIPEFLHKRKSYRSELELKSADGKQIPIALSGQMFEGIYGEQNGSFIFTDISKRLETENQLIKSLKEKNVLLAEIHHRVKNNMAIISSLLYMQSELVNSKQLKKYFSESINRIKAMATVHEMLYQSESMDNIDLQTYIEELSKKIKNSLKIETQNISIYIECRDVKLGLTKAVPLGLIINELLTNCFQHAFEENEEGTVSIKMEKNSDKLILWLKDNGKGMEDPENYMDNESMGLKIINALSRQLDAEMQIDSNNGTEVVFEIPIPQNGI